MGEGPNSHRRSLTRWPRFSPARLFVGVSVAAIGMGAIAAKNSYEIPLGDFGPLALFVCVATIWAGISLPFVRTAVYAIPIGCVLSVITFLILELLFAWLFSSMRPPPTVGP